MNQQTTRIVLTGATGFVGRHFLTQLLRADSKVSVVVLVRGKSEAEAQRRLFALLEETALEYATPFDPQALQHRLTVLCADITKPLCGLSLEQSRALRGTQTAFWHLAACLNFEESQKSRIETNNIAGTLSAIALARASGCSQFVYVSTAYTCGTRSGEIDEVAHPMLGPFGNAYERSKCAAEELVATTCVQAGLGYRILRPTIVVGMSSTGRPAGSDTGLYGFARELLRMKRILCKHDGPLRIEGDGHSEVNLVPVDFVAARMVELHRADLPEGPIFHLCAATGPSALELTTAVAEAVGVPRFEFIAELPENAAPLERILAKRISFYASYLKHSKRFISRLGGSNGATYEGTRSYVTRYLESRDHDRLSMVERVIPSRDGTRLYAARNENALTTLRETVVVINALGMPAATLENVISKLVVNHDVVTWDSRELERAAASLSGTSVAFGRQTDDLEDVMAAYGIRRAHLVGWCTGADVALEFLTRHPARVISMTCLNAGFVGMSAQRTAYQRNLERIVRRVNRSADSARLYFSLMTRQNQPMLATIQGDVQVQAQVQETMACLDENLMHLTGAPLQSVETFSRYCLQLERYFDEAPRHLPQARVPLLLATAENDDIAPISASLEIAAKWAGARLYVAREGGHFAPCVCGALGTEIVAFLAAHTQTIRNRVAVANTL